AGLAQGGQEGVGAGAQGDQVGDLALEFDDGQVEFPTPEIQAVPVEPAGVAREQRHQLPVGLGPTDAPVLGVALRQVLQPEVVVEVQVQQGDRKSVEEGKRV